MIVTLTLNPAIDHTVVVDDLVPGDTNRAPSCRTDIGGKGINVSRVLRELGCPSTAMGFVSGTTGRFIEHTLADRNIPRDFVHVRGGQTRTNITIVERRRELTTTINEPGPYTDPHFFNLLLTRLKRRLQPGDWLVIGGSVPPPLPTTVYAEVITLAKKLGVVTVLDADGPALAAGIEAGPFMVKPNRRELQRLLGRGPRKVETMLEAAERIYACGVSVVVVSQGVEGAVAVSDEGEWQVVPPVVQAESAVGSGDAMVAGMVLVLSGGGTMEEALRLGTAAGSATALTPGTEPCHQEDVARLLPLVAVRQVRGDTPARRPALALRMRGTSS
ncbi:MAG: 1-phosphofructokinase [Chloroflexi bacterium]|nr:1-phosphofructokinase [Chloroflexota bacterium]